MFAQRREGSVPSQLVVAFEDVSADAVQRRINQYMERYHVRIVSVTGYIEVFSNGVMRSVTHYAQVVFTHD